MGSKGWIKRVLPFFATFAVGIFIASFFVSVSPNVSCHRGWRHEMDRLQVENDDLRNENLRLRNSCHRHDLDVEMNGPEFPVTLDAPAPPPMPHHPPRRDK